MPRPESAAPLVAITLAGLMSHFDSYWARVFLVATQQQEDPEQLGYQKLSGGRKGPARGLWQFEQGGGVRGVMNHPASAPYAKAVCALRGVPWVERVIWERLEFDPVLACAFARLLLWTYPLALATTADAAWTQYAVHIWRPGQPHRSTWNQNWQRAISAVGTPA
jgi:hypothetical protein